MANSGFLLIADITGYTAFISHSELEPAAEHLQTFLNLLISHTRPPLQISRMQGDAVISYALEGTFLHGQTLVEMIEETYIAFRRALELFIINNACDCNACTFIPSLDIKFFVHYGEFLLQPFPTYTELIGNDVNLIHRLTKNTITKKTGIKAYIVYTESAVEKLGIRDLVKGLKAHEEHYDHIGKVLVHVQDMHPLWERRQSETQAEEVANGVLFRVEQQFAKDPVLMWDYLTQPEYKAILSGAGTVKIAAISDGRLGAGSEFQCLSGNSKSVEKIVAWAPPEEYSLESKRAFGVKGRTTIQIIQINQGSQVNILVGKGIGKPSVFLKVYNRFYALKTRPEISRNLKQLHQQIEEVLTAV